MGGSRVKDIYSMNKNDGIVEFRNWDVTNSPGWYWVISYKNDGVMENIEDGPFESKDKAEKMLSFWPYPLPEELAEFEDIDDYKNYLTDD